MKTKLASKFLIAFALAAVNIAAAETAVASGGLRTVALSGDVAPGVGGGATFTVFSTIDAAPVINNAGQVAFTRHLAGTGGFENDNGIWSEGAGSGLALVAREGSPAPGTALNFNEFHRHSIAIQTGR